MRPRCNFGGAAWRHLLRTRTVLLASAVTASLAAGGSAPARADFKVCNQTLNLLNLAVGYLSDNQVFETEGWWTLAANSCVSLIKKPLNSQYVYVYGTDIYGDEVIVGSTPMCVDGKKFVIPGTDDCWVRGYETVQFLEVDTTRKASTWTMFIRDN